MNWIKRGKIFEPSQNFPWMISHAANPFAWRLEGSIYKVFFTCRDRYNKSHIGFVIVDLEDNFKILEIGESPILKPGEPGLFDDSGVAMGYLLEIDDRIYMYYLGWNLKVTVPWLNTIGLAISDDGGLTFTKYSRAPVMDRSNEDPYSISYPSVLFESGKYKMWYGSNLNWGSSQKDMHHVIKYATSKDGINWDRSDKVILDLMYAGEYAISKPFVLRTESGFEMWYSYRSGPKGETYRIGYATSIDGLIWTRKDNKVGIDVSSDGWDSEMIQYPFIFENNQKIYMLYNGNGFGKTGFGLAEKVE